MTSIVLESFRLEWKMAFFTHKEKVKATFFVCVICYIYKEQIGISFIFVRQRSVKKHFSLFACFLYFGVGLLFLSYHLETIFYTFFDLFCIFTIEIGIVTIYTSRLIL